MATEKSSSRSWMSDAAIYQIYPRSFKDSTGSGLGDIAGITQQMDYLERLGIEAIWLSPFYPSPLVDGGYDVADYCDVDPRLGSLDDFDDMIAAAHARGIKVIVDIVPNHSSNQHPWFKAALAAGPGSPERARYIFRDGRGEHGELPPTNWNANFGGPAWTRVADGQCICTCLRPSNRTLTGHAPRFMRSFATSWRFGAIEASTAFALMWRRVSPRISTAMTSTGGISPRAMTWLTTAPIRCGTAMRSTRSIASGAACSTAIIRRAVPLPRRGCCPSASISMRVPASLARHSTLSLPRPLGPMMTCTLQSRRA